MSGQTQIGRLRALYPDKALPWEPHNGWLAELLSAHLIAVAGGHYRLTDAGKARVERSRW